MRDGLPADERSERDAEKEGTVVPGKNGGALSRKVVCKASLLSREEQLGRGGGRPKGESDEHSGIDRQLNQENARAETEETYAARFFCPDPIDHPSADQNAANRPAAIEQDGRGDFLGREAARGQPYSKIDIDAVKGRTPQYHRRQPATEKGYREGMVSCGNFASAIILGPNPPVRPNERQAEAGKNQEDARPTKGRAR